MSICLANLRAYPGSGWAVLSVILARPLVLLRLLIAVFICGLPDSAFAGAFSVDPTRIELSKSIPSAVMQVVNSSDKNTTVQLHIMHWSQVDGEDSLKPTRDLVATPQIFNLKAGATQIIRVGLLRKIDEPAEAAYRMIIEEIPPPPSPEFVGFQVALKISIPIFFTSESISKSKQKIQINLSRPKGEATQVIQLDMQNSGLSHVQFLGMQLFADDDSANLLANYENNVYVLAGKKKILLIKSTKHLGGTGVLIKAKTNSGIMEFHAKPGLP